MSVSEVGEFGLIERLARLVETRPAPRSAPQPVGLDLGIGDDAAAWRTTPDLLQLATTDTLVDQVHFDLATTGWRDLGWKALAVNVSDIAAMGGSPRYALVTLGLGRSQPAADIEELYRGVQEHCQAYGLAVVGGDIVRSATTFISVTVVGEGSEPLLRRSTGVPGYRLAVTGWLGNSAGGLRVLRQLKEQRRKEPRSAAERTLVATHRRPQPRVQEGLALAERGVTCGMDVSDGLLGDTTRLCEASGLGARLYLEALPVHPALQEVFPNECRQIALIGGEDYELLCAIAPDQVEAVQRGLERATGTRLAVVGELDGPPVHGRRVRVLDASGAEVEPSGWSWEHFS
ncbi:MAG: thiamine-phosphate kinase [Chloroflexi bacterium]|nr:thiamine-phosphate kinase [Chloroflexota bacterium]